MYFCPRNQIAMSNTNNISAEERIKAAARKVFHQKGYAATRTRDIAEEAGINHAMLNYYFRSKEKLFQIVMTETMTQFFKGVGVILNEVRPNPQFFVEQSPIGEALTHSVLARQYAEAVAQGRITEPNLMHTVLNVIGLVIFPFVAKPILSAITNLPEAQYKALMLQRKTLIPQWIKAILSLPKTDD